MTGQPQTLLDRLWSQHVVKRLSAAEELIHVDRFFLHDLGPRGIWLAGDTTCPGLGTVACVLGSRIVADGVMFVSLWAFRK